MRRFADSYKGVFADYWRDFFRGWTYEGNTLILIFLIIFINWKVFSDMSNFMAGIPVLFAIFSGISHSASMPFMMYLLPVSHEQRENYLQKMLYVKIAIPVLFALIGDFVLFFIRPVSVYVFILQMTGIFGCSLILGVTYNKGAISQEARKSVYGGLAPYVAVSLVICIAEGTALCVICMGEVGAVEFWVVFCLMLLLTLPILGGVCRHWKEIRENYAEYETASGTEVAR